MGDGVKVLLKYLDDAASLGNRIRWRRERFSSSTRLSPKRAAASRLQEASASVKFRTAFTQRMLYVAAHHGLDEDGIADG
ncbi:hypothetical protein BSL82_08410 [Tardibacter chloracetimidivorans]|uniref:Uncharacterized protein n=1 Tax=Tardibacter chloracetimidivorans TaxID=1921510 RepID=A0A1L3ZUT4_9SPHN|nr:hypothetical protein BSL82_08410 [Tardibacter chloracetimidivorans]